MHVTLLSWLAALAAIVGICWLRRPLAAPEFLDSVMRALGCLAACSLVPALLPASGFALAHPSEAIAWLPRFPVLWFITLGGGLTLGLTSLATGGLRLAQSEMMLFTIAGVQTVVLFLVLFLQFTVRPVQSRGIPSSMVGVGVAIAVNALFGALVLTSMALDD